MICDKFINIIFYVEIISQFIYSVITITLISIHKDENCTTQFELNFIQYFYISIISILAFFLWIINITNIVITMDDFKKSFVYITNLLHSISSLLALVSHLIPGLCRMFIELVLSEVSK